MYKPHYCKFVISKGGFDENRNPIPISSSESDFFDCFLDQNLPDSPIFTTDGQLVKDASGIIFLERDFLFKNKINLSIGDSVKVFLKRDDSLFFSGTIKSLNQDLFHTRVWV